jgi:hypothetical protein
LGGGEEERGEGKEGRKEDHLLLPFLLASSCPSFLIPFPPLFYLSSPSPPRRRGKEREGVG